MAGCATLVALTTTVVLDLFGDPLGALPANVYFLLMVTVPIAVLFVFLQRRLARGIVAGLICQELDAPGTSSDLREALARALGDPSLELAFWFPAENCYVNGDGGVVTLPAADSGRSSTLVERNGEPIAALLHDPVLEHNAGLVSSVCAAASLALENERLCRQSCASVDRTAASRAPRLVEATDAERRGSSAICTTAPSSGSLDRDVARPARVRSCRGGCSGATPCPRNAPGAGVALEELRELTHGINPPLLSERGLPGGTRRAMPAGRTFRPTLSW